MPRKASPVPKGDIDQFAQVVIPEGPIVVGRPSDDLFADESEKPCVEVFLDAFSFDVYPVTRDRFRSFIKEGGYQRPELWTAEGWAWRDKNGIVAPNQWDEARREEGLLPVSGVSWYEAMAFARWSDRALPTAAQWEKAARGTDGRAFPWGNDPPTPEHLNYALVVGRPTPVGSYPRGRSPFGCHDMAGNVNNWCLDFYWPGFYAYLAEGPIERRTNPVLESSLAQQLSLRLSERTDRGGGFATPVGCLSVIGTTRRLGWPPESRELWQGFRTAGSLA